MPALKPSVVGACILGIVVGVISGIAIGRARTPAAPNNPASKATPKETPPPQNVLPATEERREVPDDPAALKEIVVRQRAEIDTLAARVAELERQPQHGRPAQDKLAIAKEIYEAFLASMKAEETGEGSGNYWKVLGRLDELDESMASFFIGKYSKAEGKEESELALGLALWSGGKEAVEFIKELLRDSSLGGKARNSLLQSFAMWGDDGFYPAKPLPVDSELAQMAFQLAESPKTEERSGGAGILGHCDDPASRAKLQQLASSDSDTRVRYAVLQALGKVGDRATLAYLASYTVPSDQPDLQQQLKGAIAKLKKKYPE